MADLYIAPVSAEIPGTVYPPRRQQQLEETKHPTHRLQRYSVWKLLEYALHHSFGLSPEQLEFSLDDRGRWSCRECFFSLTHSKDAVAVAVSRSPIGIDIEAADRTLHPSLPQKILTPSELSAYDALPESEKALYLLQRWCAKESLFKWREAAEQQPAPPTHTGTVTVAGKHYCYAVTTQEEITWN